MSAAPQSPRPAEFSQEIAALWQKPSRSFSQAIESLGKESREASIKRLSDLSSGFGGNVSTLEKRLGIVIATVMGDERESAGRA